MRMYKPIPKILFVSYYADYTIAVDKLRLLFGMG
jgi:hypothetical protein